MSANDHSQRTAARVAGVAYLLSSALVVAVNFGIHERLLVPGDATQTARAILAHERLFRLSISLDLIFCAVLIVLVSALYVLLRLVNPTLAVVASLWRFAYAIMWTLMTLRLHYALRTVSGARYLQVFQPDQLNALGRMYLSMRFEEYYVGLVFYSLASAAVAYLFWKSGFIPQALALFGLVASAWCAACTLVFFVFPEMPKVVNLWLFDSPMALFEIVTGALLAFKRLPDRLPVQAAE